MRIYFIRTCGRFQVPQQEKKRTHSRGVLFFIPQPMLQIGSRLTGAVPLSPQRVLTISHSLRSRKASHSCNWDSRLPPRVVFDFLEEDLLKNNENPFESRTEARRCFLRRANTKSTLNGCFLYLRGGRDSNPQPPT